MIIIYLEQFGAEVSIVLLSSPSDLTGNDETFCFIMPQTKNPRGEGPGDRAGHGTGPARPIYFG